MPDKMDIEDIEADLDDVSSKHKRLNPAEWGQVKLLWEYGSHTLAQLSDKFGIRPDTIQRRLKDDGVSKGSKAHEVQEVQETAMHEEMAKQAAENTRRIVETRDTHYRYAEALARMTMSEVIKAKTDKRAMSTVDGNLAALNKAAKTLEVIRKERWVILGLDKEDGDPEDMDELLISELSQDQIDAMQREMRGLEYKDPLMDLEVDKDFIEETGEEE
tara:strand:- start:21583 stop:22233 length:651 start_codon:yes stop_codon:yes gene_type:complete